MGRSQSVKFQIQLMEKYVQLMEKMLANGEKLNKGQIQAINNNAKEFRRYSLKETQEKNSLKKAMDKNKLSREEFKVRKDLKSADESLVRLRSALRMQEEREHGAQVRRNIVLRDKQESFNNALGFTKNALTGGFGFSDALGRVVKSAATTTKQFNEIKRSSLSLSDAQKKYQKSLTDVSIAKMAGDPKKIKIAEDAADIAKMDMMGKFDQASENQLSGGAAENKNTKPIFEKLSKLGEFLSKKAVPIGIGLGVAGVLISVIVKAFSASPLFAAMMKLMKFMVQLILMPIGTFFGALLRPILILLLRKFIIPWYSSMMPKAISIGTAVGNFIASPWEGLKSAILGEEDGNGNGEDPYENYLPEDYGQIHPEADHLDETDRNWIQWWADRTKEWDDFWKTPQAYAEEQTGYFEQIPTDDPLHPDNLPTGDPNDTRTFEEKYNDGLEGLVPDGGTLSFDKSENNTSSSSTNSNTWGNGEGLPEYVNPVTAPEEPREMTEAEKDRELMFTNPQAWQAKQNQKLQEKRMQEEREKAAKYEANKARNERLASALAKPTQSSGADRMAAQALRNAQQETVNTYNPRFAGTPSAGKLSRSLNAGANVGAAMDKNASRGHTMGSSQAGSDILREYWASRGVTMAAEGFDGMVNSPTMFMAGEAGAEHVKVTPSGQGGGGNITVNIQNMNGSDDDLRKLKKTILEVIQQSANNRGRI